MRAVALLTALLLQAQAAAAQLDSRRALSEREMRIAFEALLREPTAALSENPSCRADLSQPGAMSIAQGLAIALLRAATDGEAVTVNADCFVRRGYPIGPGEEYCRLAFTSASPPSSSGYGLVFRMDWNAARAVPSSVECYGMN
jgi:hypothetical protein